MTFGSDGPSLVAVPRVAPRTVDDDRPSRSEYCVRASQHFVVHRGDVLRRVEPAVQVTDRT